MNPPKITLFFALLLTSSGWTAGECPEKIRSITNASAKGNFEMDGYEILPVNPLGEKTINAVFELFSRRTRNGHESPALKQGKLTFRQELQSTPEDHRTIEELTQYLQQVVGAASARLEKVRGANPIIDARIDIRWSDSGVPPVTDSSAQRSHVDGGHGTIALTLVGPPTVIDAISGSFTSPLGTPVLMVGQEGVRNWNLPGGYHHTPDLSAKPRRLFIQINF